MYVCTVAFAFDAYAARSNSVVRAARFPANSPPLLYATYGQQPGRLYKIVHFLPSVPFQPRNFDINHKFDWEYLTYL
jgi:hypothetical protein